MNRNIKYKQVCRIGIFGDDDVNTTTSSQYISPPSNIPGAIVNSGGTNYVAANTQVIISGGGGNSAIANATVSSGAVSGITFINSGNGYTSAPIITLTSGVNTYTSLLVVLAIMVLIHK